MISGNPTTACGPMVRAQRQAISMANCWLGAVPAAADAPPVSTNVQDHAAPVRSITTMWEWPTCCTVELDP
jgi:hypothetical protein